MRPPASNTDANARNPVPANTSPTSVSSIPYRRSGLSEPYRSIISSKVIRGNGVATSTPWISRTMREYSGSITANTSSSSTKDISTSSCVNSKLRSARVCSSRRHRTIW